MNATLEALRAEQARINAELLAATADAFADAIRRAAREAGHEPTRVAVEFYSDDDGGHWPGMTLVLDAPDVADQLDGDVNDWPEFKDWCDALVAVDGRESLFGRTVDLTAAGTTATDGHDAGDELHAALLPVAAHLDVPVDAITSVSWLTIGIDGQPVHLHVTYDTTGAWADEVVDDETYIYPDDGDAWHDAVALAEHLFDGTQPHDQWEDHRYEWTWRRNEPEQDAPVSAPGSRGGGPDVAAPDDRPPSLLDYEIAAAGLGFTIDDVKSVSCFTVGRVDGRPLSVVVTYEQTGPDGTLIEGAHEFDSDRVLDGGEFVNVIEDVVSRDDSPLSWGNHQYEFRWERTGPTPAALAAKAATDAATDVPGLGTADEDDVVGGCADCGLGLSDYEPDTTACATCGDRWNKIVPVAEHLGVPVGAITSVSWLTIGVGGQPAHLHVTYETSRGNDDEVVGREAYIYRADGEVWDDAVDLARYLFDGTQPHDRWEDDRYEWCEWTWHRNPTVQDTPAVTSAPQGERRDRVVWAARSDKARKQAITAVTVLRPDLNRTQAADVLRDTHPDAWAPGKDDVLAVAEAYSSDRVQAVHAAVAALVDRLGTGAGVLSPANPVDGAAWVHAAGYGVGMQLADGREASVHAPSQDRDTGRVSGGWSQLAIVDGGRVERLVDTGLPVECSDPLRVAKAVVKAVVRLLAGD